MKKPYFKILVVICMTLIYACADSSKQKETTPDTTEKTEKSKKTEKTKQKENIVKNTKPAFGIDISSYQGNEIDNLEKGRDDLDFIICKATQGVTLLDPQFQHNWTTIKAKGFIRGAYHFFVSTDNPASQAAFFLGAIKDIQATDLPPIIDIEAAGIDTSQSVEEIQQNALTLLQKIESSLQVTPIIYTNVEFADDYLVNKVFAKYPLWIADYQAEESPVVPVTWQEKGYVLWQKSDTYKIRNYTNDADVFNGDLESLKTFIKNSRQ